MAKHKRSLSVREALTQQGFSVKPLVKARHARRVAGRMNATERNFAGMFLQPLVASGEILSWAFENVKFSLCPGVTYTPDFELVLADHQLLYIEVKGSWKAAHQDKSRVKLKVCAYQFPKYHFAAYEFQRHKLEWFGPNQPPWLSVFEKQPRG